MCERVFYSDDKIIYRLIYNRLNLTNADEPFFIIDSLDAFTSFDTYGDDAVRAVVYSVNQKGRSHGVLVKEFQFDNGVESRQGNYGEKSWREEVEKRRIKVG